MQSTGSFSPFILFLIFATYLEAVPLDNDGFHDTLRYKNSSKTPFFGDQSHPAKSCKEIFKQMPNLPSGVYWLDVVDFNKNKTIQEKHFCENTQTGLNVAGQSGEIGIENLSAGKPAKEPFDWEELTNENWPLPISPPTKEEMEKRLDKAIKDYRKKIKTTGPTGSGLIADAKAAGYEARNSPYGSIVIESPTGDSATHSDNKSSYATGYSQPRLVNGFQDLKLDESVMNTTFALGGNPMQELMTGNLSSTQPVYETLKGMMYEKSTPQSLENVNFNFGDQEKVHDMNASPVNLGSSNSSEEQSLLNTNTTARENNGPNAIITSASPTPVNSYKGGDATSNALASNASELNSEKNTSSKFESTQSGQYVNPVYDSQDSNNQQNPVSDGTQSTEINVGTGSFDRYGDATIPNSNLSSSMLIQSSTRNSSDLANTQGRWDTASDISNAAWDSHAQLNQPSSRNTNISTDYYRPSQFDVNRSKSVISGANDPSSVNLFFNHSDAKGWHGDNASILNRTNIVSSTVEAKENSTSLPAVNQSNENSASLPSVNQSNENSTSLPSVNQSNENSASLPSLNQSNENSASLPSLNQSSENSTSLPSVNQSNENSTSLPSVNQSNENLTSLPSVNKSNENSTSLPSVNQLNENSASLPSLNQSSENSASLPSVNQSNENSTSLPSVNQSNENSNSLPSVNQSNENARTGFNSSDIYLNITMQSPEKSSLTTSSAINGTSHNVSLIRDWSPSLGSNVTPSNSTEIGKFNSSIVIDVNDNNLSSSDGWGRNQYWNQSNGYSNSVNKAGAAAGGSTSALRNDLLGNPFYSNKNQSSASIDSLTSVATGSRQNWNPGYDHGNLIDRPANAESNDSLRTDLYWNPGYTTNNRSATLNNGTASDNIRSNQYWNPGYSAGDGPANEGSKNILRTDLYWNPGHVRNISLDARKNESLENATFLSSSDFTNRSQLWLELNNSFRNVNENCTTSAATDDSKQESYQSNLDYNNGTNYTQAYINPTNPDYDLAKDDMQANKTSIEYFGRQIVSANGNNSKAEVSKNAVSYQRLQNENNTIVSYNPGNGSEVVDAISDNSTSYNLTVGQYSLSENGNTSNQHNMSTEYESGMDQKALNWKKENRSTESPDTRNDVRNRTQNNHEKEIFANRRMPSNHGRVKMVLKNWSKVVPYMGKQDRLVDKKSRTEKIRKSETIKFGRGKAETGAGDKDSERDGLFIKPGLNRGVIETKKETMIGSEENGENSENESAIKLSEITSGMKAAKNMQSLAPRASLKDGRQALNLGKFVGQQIPAKRPLLTRQAIENSENPMGDPVSKPNPDELDQGIWTEEASDYSRKAEEDFEKQAKYVSKHGGAMDDLIKEYNEAKEDHNALHDPQRAERTKEKMQEFYSRNKEISSQPAVPLNNSSKIVKGGSPVANRYEKMEEKNVSDSKMPVASLNLAIGSSTGSKSGSETETWAKVGASAGSSSESQDEQENFNEDSDWYDEEPDYDEYDQPQGLGLWTDSETGTGVGISIGASADSNAHSDSDAEAESEMGINIGSPYSSSPGFRFSNGFGMGVGSQSGSETMSETSVGVNSVANTQTDSKTDAGSQSESNPGSKSKSRYKWKMGSSASPAVTNTNKLVGKVDASQNAKEQLGDIADGNKGISATHPGAQEDRGSPSAVDQMQIVKEKAKFKPDPQLGIQVSSDVNTKVHASAQTQSGTGGGGSKTNAKSKPKTTSQINLEKAREHLKKQMLRHQKHLEEVTRNNSLHRVRVETGFPAMARLEKVAEKTRKKPLGPMKVDNTRNGGRGENAKADSNKVEASVDISYQGKNTKGVDINAEVNISNGGKSKQPKKTSQNNGRTAAMREGHRNWRTMYKWYQKYPYTIPSIAEINRKLNSMPFALYKAEMQKMRKRAL